MGNRRYLAGMVVIAGLIVGGNFASAKECGDVSIASMSWSSAEIIAEIDRIILSTGYGCNAQLSIAETMPAFNSMVETGQPDVVPELWINAVRAELEAAVDEGLLIMAAEILADGGEEGWWIPKYTADAYPDIKTASDALERPELFPDTDDETVAALYSCPSDWGCQISSGNLFRAFDAAEKGFTLINPGSAAGLDASIAKAYENGVGWLGYYWAPTSLLGRYEMVKLDMGEHDKTHWDSCTAIPDCDEPQVNAWPTSDVFSVVTREFSERAGVVMDYLSTRQWNNDTVNQLLIWMADNQASGQETAQHFLDNYEDIWSDWVADDVFVKVKSSFNP